MNNLLQTAIKELTFTLDYVRNWEAVTDGNVTIYVPAMWVDFLVVKSIRVVDDKCIMGTALIEFILDVGEYLINVRLMTNAAGCSRAAGYDGINLTTGLITLEFKYDGVWYNSFNCEVLNKSNPKVLHSIINILDTLHKRLSVTGKVSGSMFIREVPSAEFITGVQLASQIGLTAGISQHSTAGWLKFADTVDGKTKYISKKPLRHTISWDQIHAVGAVFGTKTVVIGGLTYKVRLLKGVNANPLTTVNDSFDHVGTWGCEWNRLLYHISAKPFTNPNTVLQSERLIEGDWASYSEADLLTHYSHSNGNAQWCQETGTDEAARIIRGYHGVSYLAQNTASYASASFGWRPVLELVD